MITLFRRTFFTYPTFDVLKNPKIFLKKIAVKPKPWGREIWFAWTDRYAGKILELKKGHQFSLQYHERKMETQYLVKGKLKVTKAGMKLGASLDAISGKRLQSKILKAGDKIDILPYTIHRALALEPSVIFEVSTPELDDVVKLADDYGRKGKGNNETLDKRLAGK